MTTFEWLHRESEKALVKRANATTVQECQELNSWLNELRGRLNSHIRETRKQRK